MSPILTMASLPTAFDPLPDSPRLDLAWPTPNHLLFSAPHRFFAATRANPLYGRPGWTRDCGRRFHRGCDIAPLDPIPTGETTTVEFTNCETGEEYRSEEPVRIGTDPIFAVAAGTIEESVTDPDQSPLGLHVVIRHAGPDGAAFFTLYAHLSYILVRAGDCVVWGQEIGAMGATSSRADARNWMRVAPHLHFEVWNSARRPLDPALFLQHHLRR